MVDGGYLRSGFGFGQGFDRYLDQPVHIARIVDQVESMLHTLSSGRSFVFIHCYDVHAPYTPPPPFDTRFEDQPYTGTFEPTVANLGAATWGQGLLTAADLGHVIARYDGGIAYTDTQVERLLAALEHHGLLDSTLVVITSDHGEEFLEHGSFSHWQTYFMPNLHVPLVFFVPGWAPRTIDGPVELIDVLPTVLDLLGLPPHPGAMGRSLVPAMLAGRGDQGGSAYAEPNEKERLPHPMPWRTVITSQHQLLLDPGSQETRLFDIRADPGATVDLARREAGTTARLLATLREREREVALKIPPPGGPPTSIPTVDGATRDQLRALGYVE